MIIRQQPRVLRHKAQTLELGTHVPPPTVSHLLASQEPALSTPFVLILLSFPALFLLKV